ncbi:solute carrier organic anion transporter family member 4A1 [Thrips palmi]|uniref:Solute carrier organic anion transporter family member n=1 Tax=Thrips palmi TaxID=161013 RepID=A0A6P9A6R7_THRPL|nr:solute carrier organic anion transporter family member 4A1 [Thrips palmi]XP_034253663.1 solute carrier organic anion transporter family member 4A1 [Thrips palmi]XP_034253664.1 solute carrier organic anion transporter family member 4A1 [Thrips palmi]
MSPEEGAMDPPAVELGVSNPAFSATQDELQEDVSRTRAKQDAMVPEKNQNGHGVVGTAAVAKPAKRDDPDGDDLACGWGCLRPRWMQQFRTSKWILFWLCWAGGVQGMVVNGFVNVVITTIERRFGLRSSQSGLVAGGYDIASFLCLVPVTYLGGRAGASKPRWIAWGIVLMGCGSLLFASPHFLAGPYRGAVHRQDTCRTANSTLPTDATAECDVAHAQSDTALYMWLFLLGQLLHGAGAAPLFTLGVTFIDENVSKKMSSVYLGIFYTMAVVGPAMGYVLGGQLLRVYTDFLVVDPADIGLTLLSNVWVGAWWIGFIVSALLCFLLAIPLLAFPFEMPGAAELRAERVSEAHGVSSSSTTEAFSKLRELPQAFRALIANPAFFFLNLAGASEGLLLSGFAAFLPKLIENQFSVAASRAALLMGLVTVPAGGGGTFLGGYLVKRFSLNCAAIIKLCILASGLGVLCAISFVISCPNVAFAGVTRGYGDNATSLSTPKLESACNAGCQCDGAAYNPVCGADNVLYYSPCHAGCSKEVMLDAARVYSDCSCVNAYNAAPLESPVERRRRRRRYTTPGDDPEEDGEAGAFQDRSIGGGSSEGVEYDAINEPCTSSCDLLWVFIALAFVTMLFTFLITMPALTATLRVVQDEQRSFALGIQWIKVRLLGTIPAPMIFGLLIDETCALWRHDPCDGGGSCIAYDNLSMSRYMLALAVVVKLCSLLFFTLAWRLYKPPSGLHASSQEKLEEGIPVDSLAGTAAVTVTGVTDVRGDVEAA